VSLIVYNALGEQVESTKMFGQGAISWRWNAEKLGSGIYWLEVKSSNQRALKKVVYIR
jgi:hypothetical protein